MFKTRGLQIISALQQKWSRLLLLSLLLQFTAVAILLSAIAAKWLHLNPLFIPLIVVIVIIPAFIFNPKKVSEAEVAIYMNKVLPELEESTELLLKAPEKLNLLEQLQVQKIDSLIESSIPPPYSIRRRLKISFICMISSLLLSIFLFQLPDTINASPTVKTLLIKDRNSKSEVRLPQIKQTIVSIIPPSYTIRNARKQHTFNILAEEGSRIKWTLQTNTRVKTVQLIFSDRTVLNLQLINEEGTKWQTNKQISKPGFYQVKIEEMLSELYRLEIINDRPPVIVLQSPKPTTIIEPGQPKRTRLQVRLTDDYGIRQALIHATVASGSGEAVKFKEQQLTFSSFKSGNKNYQLQQTLDLSILGLKAGDELYFYVNAVDNHAQATQSDVYIVRIEDTAPLLELEGLASGIDIKPEFFRSQRQIILETEQLINSKDTISKAAFQKKSNDLAIDQKLLRLRYGKFLGEETDAEIGPDHDHEEEEHNHENEYGNVKQLMDEVAHKHDNAEDATFFDAQTKKQLKATLAEMWQAELQLRLAKPTAALPFEYKALKLLKELQQQTRVYVAKTGIKTTPLKPEKRLTGDLGGITTPITKNIVPPPASEAVMIRKALGILEQLKSKENLHPSALTILDQANQKLANRAASEPSAYISSLQALRRIIQHRFSSSDITIAGKGLRQLIQEVPPSPQRSVNSANKTLSDRYFKNLNRRHD